jgi:hypothetical protein
MLSTYLIFAAIFLSGVGTGIILDVAFLRIFWKRP